MSGQFTLGKRERLKSHKLIESLFKSGQRFSCGSFRAVYQEIAADAGPLQCGFTASTKSFPKAADRNRVKRLMREAYRLQKHTLQEQLSSLNLQLVMFVIYTGRELPTQQEATQQIGEILARLQKIVSKPA